MTQQDASKTKKVLDQGPLFAMRGAVFNAANTLQEMLRSSPADQKCATLVRFDSDELGNQSNADYSDQVARLDYFVNYAYGYGYEYFRMWQDVLDDMASQGDTTSPLNVLSLGCGYGIDFWALRTALKERRQAGRQRCLIGVDYADWSDCCIGFITMRDSERGSRYLWNWDAAAYLESERAAADGALQSNVIVFPKSLGEMDGATVGRIARSLGKMARERDLYLCICPPHGDGEVLWHDQNVMAQKLSTILQAMTGDPDHAPVACGEDHRSNAYISELTSTYWSGHLDRDQERSLTKAKWALCECCEHAGEGDCCPWRIEHPYEPECPLAHNPIVTGKYPCYRVYRIPRQR